MSASAQFPSTPLTIDALELPVPLLRDLRSAGLTEPTPIQARAIRRRCGGETYWAAHKPAQKRASSQAGSHSESVDDRQATPHPGRSRSWHLRVQIRQPPYNIRLRHSLWFTAPEGQSGKKSLAAIVALDLRRRFVQTSHLDVAFQRPTIFRSRIGSSPASALDPCTRIHGERPCCFLDRLSTGAGQ